MNRQALLVCASALVLSVLPPARASAGGMPSSVAPASESPMPSRLVGTWGRTVTAATWRKYGVSYEQAGHWGIKITVGGVTSLLEPPGTPQTAPLTTMHTTATGATVVFGPTADGFCPHKATYSWKTSGRTLSLKLVRDDCTARRVLLSAGTWART